MIDSSYCWFSCCWVAESSYLLPLPLFQESVLHVNDARREFGKQARTKVLYEPRWMNSSELSLFVLVFVSFCFSTVVKFTPQASLRLLPHLPFCLRENKYIMMPLDHSNNLLDRWPHYIRGAAHRDDILWMHSPTPAPLQPPFELQCGRVDRQRTLVAAPNITLN